MNFIPMIEIFDNSWNLEHDKLLWEKIQLRRKLYSTEYDTEIKDLEGRNSEYASIESQHELESQRLQLRQASQWADQAQRERINLCGE